MKKILQEGLVSLTGAGPGDIGLLTMKGYQALSRADVVVYDALANSRLLDLAPPTAKKIDAGKNAGKHKMKQEDTNRILVKLGKQGKRVVRLKGGDPFVFGRGSEEAEALAAAGVAFEIIPGISSGIAGPAYAGIPVTHRGIATQVTFTTGQEKKGKPLALAVIKRLAALPGTLVLFMSQANLPRLCSGLIQGGKSASTPAAAVHQGTLPGQRVIVSTLKNLADEVKSSGLGSPMLFVVGPVAALREKIAWFDQRHLSSLRVLVTRPAAQATRLTGLLEDKGAKVTEIPTIKISPLPLKPAGKKWLGQLAKFDWVLLSSANGVHLFFKHLKKMGLDARSFGTAKVSAIGPATAGALAQYGIKADLVPSDTTAEGLIKALKRKTAKLKGLKVLVARAQQGRELLPQTLKKHGAQVNEIALYKTSPAGFDHRAILKQCQENRLDMAVFTSASTVKHFLRPFSKTEKNLLTSVLEAACIGPITSAAAREAGFVVRAQSRSASLDNLTLSIEKSWLEIQV